MQLGLSNRFLVLLVQDYYIRIQAVRVKLEIHLENYAFYPFSPWIFAFRERAVFRRVFFWFRVYTARGDPRSVILHTPYFIPKMDTPDSQVEIVNCPTYWKPKESLGVYPNTYYRHRSSSNKKTESRLSSSPEI